MAESDESAEKVAERIDPDEDYGYDFYPERQGVEKKGILQKLHEGRSAGQSARCFKNVAWCIQKNPMVKLLIGALKSQGCEFDTSRHVSCEECISRVNGGYDPKNNQVVVCKNNSSSPDVCCSVLTHELIHMFDFCRAKADFTKLEHLACTEIRAASIMHCSFLSAMNEGDASFINYKAKHQECVKKKATMSVMLARNVTQEDARATVDKVFNKCYKDLEPFGRVPRRGSQEPHRIAAEGALYGYCN